MEIIIICYLILSIIFGIICYCLNTFLAYTLDILEDFKKK